MDEKLIMNEELEMNEQLKKIDLLEINNIMDLKEINKKLDLVINNLDCIKEQNNSMNKKIHNLSKKINNIENIKLNTIEDNCKKMSEHIDFIDNVYDNFKYPMNFICNKINYLNGKELKEIQEK